ncbi:NAD(P)-dependent oxidoreductase [Rhodococcus sp. MS16]|uniref:NAD(P)-dependent oxidoreductase n=1 Tax=Rhodococcus sp. MS16 TaxID=2579941 RepID=UPI000E270674|nr:NAD(P)-dependent oxidoreductase [Rhodococcus sp. MS16]NRI69804.1 NAD(P)-dependent oxidoreductase [Rhodococcus sp. MS16]
MKIGFIGAGRMGGPIVERLIAAGNDVTVLTRGSETRSTAKAKGWKTSDTIEQTVQSAELVISIVLNDEQVQAALLGSAGAVAAMAPGAILVQHTTCDPDTAVMVADAGAERGVHVLDAAVSGSPQDTAAGRLTLWVGGDEYVLDSVRPVLESYGSPVMHVGPIGHGQRVKLVNNALFVAQIGLAVDAVRLAAAVGIGEAEILAAIQHGSGDSRALSSLAWIGVDAVGIRLAELMLKDVDVIRQIADRTGADLGLIGEVLSSELVEREVLYSGAPPNRELIEQTPLTPGSMKPSM